jgi:hypothetical protein
MKYAPIILHSGGDYLRVRLLFRSLLLLGYLTDLDVFLLNSSGPHAAGGICCSSNGHFASTVALPVSVKDNTADRSLFSASSY